MVTCVWDMMPGRAAGGVHSESVQMIKIICMSMGGVGICKAIEGRGCPSDQIFHKKTLPTTTKTIPIKQEQGLMHGKIPANPDIAFVFKKCPKMHHQK